MRSQKNSSSTRALVDMVRDLNGTQGGHFTSSALVDVQDAFMLATEMVDGGARGTVTDIARMILDQVRHHRNDLVRTEEIEDIAKSLSVLSGRENTRAPGPLEAIAMALGFGPDGHDSAFQRIATALENKE